MRQLGIDIETYSGFDLSEVGVYRYAEHPDFAILLFAYSVDHGPVQCADLASGESLPDEVIKALTDPAVTKTAYNAQFERVCISKWLGLPGPMDPRQWQCTMVRAARLGLPLPLGQCAEVLGLEEGKMKEGMALIRYFSKPDRQGRRRMPHHDPEGWAAFKEYNIRDVKVEQAVLAKVGRYEAPDFDDELYIADQEINDRGVATDLALAQSANRMAEEYKSQLMDEARKLTGLENPNSPAQILAYLEKETRQSFKSLTKKAIEDIEEKLAYWPKAQRLVRLRKEMGKTSCSKYSAMLKCICDDGRIHGLLQFYGANRTGRWAGRLVQVQNLPQNHLDDIGYARSLARMGDLEEFSMAYPAVTQTLSELIRTAFTASEGRMLHVCDFSAIEARVIAWYAGEKWVLDVFRNGGDIYCATASQMFHEPVEKHGKNSHLRAKGKIAVLALGYNGGVAALEAMGGKRLGLSESEEKDIVSRWRESNPRIVRMWKTIDDAAKGAIKDGRPRKAHRGIEIGKRWGMLYITLPSGRTMFYPRASVETEEDDGWRGTHETIEYEGVSQATKKWGKVRTYGGKLVENIVQATARDILGEVILRARAKGLDIVFHIHDEIVVDAKEGQTLEEIEELFSQPIPWCRDLPLTGAGYSTPYYLKD